MDRRQFQRISYSANAEIKGSKKNWLTETHQISLEGLEVKKPENWLGKVGEHYTIVFPIGEESPAFQLQMVVVVKHQDADIVGFSIEHIDLESLSHLARLIELHLGDADLMKAELNKINQSAHNIKPESEK